jgi:hypothetical protein
MIKPRHGSRLRTIVREALAASSRVTTSDIAQLAYPNIWPLDKQHYRYARWAARAGRASGNSPPGQRGHSPKAIMSTFDATPQ